MSIVDERGYGGENRDEARRELQRIGMEAIACYRPIHFQGRERWGIYLHERLFFGACAELAASLGAAHWHEIVADLLDSVYQHELFHGAVELFGLVVEDFSICGGSHACLYKAYFENDYQRTYPTADCLGLKQASAEG